MQRPVAGDGDGRPVHRVRGPDVGDGPPGPVARADEVRLGDDARRVPVAVGQGAPDAAVERPCGDAPQRRVGLAGDEVGGHHPLDEHAGSYHTTAITVRAVRPPSAAYPPPVELGFLSGRADTSGMSERTRAHGFVSGTVQGVYYRATTRDTACEEGVDGWVRNLEDGRVEAVFEGEADRVASMVEWCHTGSPRADVDDIDVEHEEPEGVDGFEIRY